MEPVTTTTFILAVIQNKAFQDFISRAGSRIASDAVRSRFTDKQGGGNLPALSEAQHRYLTAQNDREERGLELQQLHLKLLHQQHQQDIALGLQKIQAAHGIAHWPVEMSRDETVQLLTQAQAKHRLLLFLSQPDVSPSCPETFRDDLHREARAKVKQFLEQHYPLSDPLQPVEFFGKFFQSSVFDTQVKQLQNLLPGIPAVVLYSDLTDEMFYLHLYAWGLPEPLSGMVEWNWEEAKETLEASGVTEKQALREIRKTIVALYQICAALLADLYYLSVNPLHEPRVFHLSGSADTDTALNPYFDKLREFQCQVREAYEQAVQLKEPILTQSMVMDYLDSIVQAGRLRDIEKIMSYLSEQVQICVNMPNKNGGDIRLEFSKSQYRQHLVNSFALANKYNQNVFNLSAKINDDGKSAIAKMSINEYIEINNRYLSNSMCAEITLMLENGFLYAIKFIYNGDIIITEESATNFINSYIEAISLNDIEKYVSYLYMDFVIYINKKKYSLSDHVISQKVGFDNIVKYKVKRSVKLSSLIVNIDNDGKSAILTYEINETLAVNSKSYIETYKTRILIDGSLYINEIYVTRRELGLGEKFSLGCSMLAEWLLR